jgi:muconate cycloisomerase
MQIVRVEAATVRADLAKPYITAIQKGGLKEVHCVVVRMLTDDGLCGIGESDPFPGFGSESPESVMAVIRRYLGPAILGMEASNLSALHAKMDAVIPGVPFSKAPLEMAAYDLLGQALGVPVYQLLGGNVRDRVPILWPIGAGTPKENVDEVTEKLAEGYRSFHVKLGSLTHEEDINRVKAIREAVGEDVPLMVDINQGWDRSTALRSVRRLEAFNLSLIEQPVPAWDMESMAVIQAAIRTPLSADEALSSPHDAVALIRRDAARAASLKHGKCGGLFRTRQIAAIFEAARLPCFVNSMIEMGISVAASLHLAASVPNLIGHGHALMSHLRIKEDILVAHSFQYDGKDMLVPKQCAGLGVEIDEDKLQKRTLERFTLALE